MAPTKEKDLTEPLPFDASEIENWAASDDARSKLPNLVRWLVGELGNDVTFDIPGGSSVVRSGWDGLTSSVQGNQWVPQGKACWEFSCDKNIKKAADDNYEKRTADPLGVDVSESTFVFITPRRWGRKRAWVRERSESSPWADVLCWDADDLVAWLEAAPQAAQRFADLIDRRFAALQIRRRALLAEREGSDISAQVAELRTIMLSRLPDESTRAVTSNADSTDPEHQELQSEIDSCKELIDLKLIDTARRRLERLRNSGEDIPETQEFRVLTNLAVCYMANERIDEASELFEEAFQLQPDNRRAVTNAALAAQMRKDSERAMELAELARESDPMDSQATAIILGELWATGKEEEFERFLASEDWASRDPHCALVVVGIRAYQGQFEEASDLCRYLTARNAEDTYAHLALSQCLLMQFQSTDIQARYSEKSLSLLIEANAAADRAVNLLEDTQLDVHRQEALIARAATSAHLGDITASENDLNMVLTQEPTHRIATLNKGMLLFGQGKYGQARPLLESVVDNEMQMNVTLPLVETLLALGNTTAAVDILRDKFELSSPGWDDIWLAEALMRAEDRAGVGDSVGPVLESSISQNPDDPKLLTLAAKHRQMLEKTEEAESLLKSALEHAQERDRYKIQIELGMFYEGTERFLEAAEAYDKISDGNPSHPIAVRALGCLFNGGQRRAALELARAMRDADVQQYRAVAEVEARVFDFVGDMPGLLKQIDKLCSLPDSTMADYVRLALTYLRSGERDKARETVLAINPSDLSQEPIYILKLAELKQTLGIDGFLDDAYWARRIGIDDPDIHLGYFMLFQSLDEDLESPSIISRGCSVLLNSEEDSRWVYLLDDEGEPQNINEIAQRNELAQLLMGRSVGDRISLREDLEELSYDVSAIQSKFVRAFQETIDNFSTLFPGNMALSRIKIENDNYSKLFQAVDQTDQVARKLDELYRTGRLPISTFSSLLRRSPVEVWGQYTNDSSGLIHYRQGTDEEDNEARLLIEDADIVILDTIALLTVHELELADKLRNRFERVALPQKVYEEILNLDLSVRLGKKPAGFLSRNEDGTYTHIEMPDDVWAEWKDHLGSLLEFAGSFEKVPSYPLLDADDIEELIGAFTELGAATIYAGNDQSTGRHLLISDDLLLCIMARSLGVNCVNTQAILLELLESDSITEKEFSSYVERLTLLNYRFVRVSATDILNGLNESGYMTTAGTRAMLRTLEGPDCTEDSAAVIGAAVVADLAGKAQLNQIGLILHSILETLSNGRENLGVLWKFRRLIASAPKLQMLPIHQQQILQDVDAYIRRMLGRQMRL